MNDSFRPSDSKYCKYWTILIDRVFEVNNNESKKDYENRIWIIKAKIGFNQNRAGLKPRFWY